MQTDNVSGGKTLLHMHKQVRTHRLPGALVGVVHIQLQTPQWSFHFLKPQGVQDVFRQPLLAFLCCFLILLKLALLSTANWQLRYNSLTVAVKSVLKKSRRRPDNIR